MTHFLPTVKLQWDFLTVLRKRFYCHIFFLFKLIFFSISWTLEAFNREEFSEKFKFLFFKERLDENTVKLASGCNVVCCFVNDTLDGKILRALNDYGISMVALRCAGFDKVDVEIAKAYDFTIARVPAYSPYAVAEHAITLVMALNRRIHRAYQRTRDGNFDLSGLIGFDLHGKTVGVIGTGMLNFLSLSYYLK